MTSTRRAALVLAVAALGFAPLGARAGTVWTAVASEKIRPQEAARADASASLEAAKNEFEAFQVVVTGAASGVSATASELKGPGTIPAPKLFREELINLDQPSSADGATGQFPDALVPDVDDVVGEKRNAFPFDVHDGESRAIWVEYLVPADAPAGLYTGTVTIHGSDGDKVVPVQFTVFDFVLPSTASLKTAFVLTRGSLVVGHGVQGEALTALRQKYAQLALDHRVSVTNIWDDGNRDWSHIDNAYGPFLDGVASTQLKGARLTTLESGADLSSTSEHADWATHARGKGWFERLFQYTCDEPPITCQWSDIPARAAVAKAADPEFRTLVTTDIDQAKANGVDGAIDLMTALVNYVDDRGTDNHGWTAGGDKSASYAPFVKSAPRKELWMYQSCMSQGCGGTVAIGSTNDSDQYFTGWPTYMIDASAVRSRSMEWLSFRYGGTGELYYEMGQAFYDRDPWTSQWEFSGNGDGTLFYPGKVAKIGGQTDIPVASIRLKMIREGMEDYEYLKLLSDLGGADVAQAIAAKLFPHAWQADAKPADLMAAREQLAREILSRSSKPPPAVAGTTPGATPMPTSAAGGGGGGCGSTGGSGLATLLLAPLALIAVRRRRRRTA